MLLGLRVRQQALLAKTLVQCLAAPSAARVAFCLCEPDLPDLPYEAAAATQRNTAAAAAAVATTAAAREAAIAQALAKHRAAGNRAAAPK